MNQADLIQVLVTGEAAVGVPGARVVVVHGRLAPAPVKGHDHKTSARAG